METENVELDTETAVETEAEELVGEDMTDDSCVEKDAPDERCEQCNQRGECWEADGTAAATDDPAPETEPAAQPAELYESKSTLDNEPRPPRDETKREREQEQRQLNMYGDQLIDDSDGSDQEITLTLDIKDRGKILVLKGRETPASRILENIVLALRGKKFNSALEGFAGEQVQPRCFEPQSYPLPVSISELQRDNDRLQALCDKLEGECKSLDAKIAAGASPNSVALHEAVAEACDTIADLAEELEPQTDAEAVAAAEASIAAELEEKTAEAEEAF